MIPEEIKKEIDKRVESAKIYISSEGLENIRLDIEFGYGLALQQIADKEKERLYWQQLAEAGAKVIQQYERTGCNYETDSYKIWQQLKDQKPKEK